MEEKTTRILIASTVVILLAYGIFGGGFTALTKQLSPAQTIQGNKPCTANGQTYTEGYILNNMQCVNGMWNQITNPTVVTNPYTTQPVSAGIPTACPSDGLDDFQVIAHDSLDDQTQGYSYVGNLTLAMTQGGGVVTSGISSATGAISMTPACGPGSVALFTTGADIYPEDTAVITYPATAAGYEALPTMQRRVTYSGETIPLTYLGSDNVKHGMVKVATIVNVVKHGNLTVMAWDTNGLTNDNNLSLTTSHGIVNSFAKVRIQETESERAARGVTILVDYNKQNISALYLTDPNSVYEFVRDDNIIPSYYSAYDAAFRVRSYATKDWLQMDASTTTPAPNMIDAIVNIETRDSPSLNGEETMTFRAIDTAKILTPGIYEWANSGAYAAEDLNYNNIGMAEADEGTASLTLHYSD